jgi:hypothetical protein
VLLRLVYLSVTNLFALLRLLPASDRDKDVEILALRHQIMVLERQLDKTRLQFLPSDRAFLRLPRPSPWEHANPASKPHQEGRKLATPIARRWRQPAPG